MGINLSWKAWAALGLFVVQNGCAGVILHQSQHSTGYSSQVAVLMQELVKLPVCFVLFMIECGGPASMMSSLYHDATTRTAEWVMMSVPALLYTVQNNCLYLGFLHLEAAVGQVTYQSKIFFTALCSVWMLGKRLGRAQWLALLLLAAGVVCVQAADWFSPGGKKRRKSAAPAEQGGGAAQIQQVASLGLAAFFTAAMCTSFASVYFEKMLKSSSQPSLWLRNIQLAAYSSAIAMVALKLQSDPLIEREGYFHGFNQATWLSIVWQALGGILVAVTIKYADNILRGFAQALAIIVASLGSSMFSAWKITPSFCAGVVLVISAVFLYGDACPAPDEALARARALIGSKVPPIQPEEEQTAKERLMTDVSPDNSDDASGNASLSAK